MRQGLRRGAAARLAMLVAGAVLAAVLVGAGSAGGAFKGKNGKIAFVLNTDYGQKIFVMNANGSGRRQLTFKPRCKGYNCVARMDIHPAWSPNGRRIAFTRSAGGTSYRIHVMNANGSGQKQLTRVGGKAYEADPAWSPDGKRIAFASQRGSNRFIYVMNANGSGLKRLTPLDSEFDASNPAWSPDGTKIAFSSEGSSLVSVMNADGSAVKHLATRNNNNYGDAAPSWSPDGARIVYMMPDGAGLNQLWVMNSDGTAQRQITTSGPPRSPAYKRPQFSQPSWSPDGAKIAFRREEAHRGSGLPLIAIAVMNPDGSGQRVLTKATLFPEYPDWGPVPR